MVQKPLKNTYSSTSKICHAFNDNSIHDATMPEFEFKCLTHAIICNPSIWKK